MSYSSFTRGEATAFDHVDAPLGVVALIVLVVDFAVEEFQADRDAGVLSDLLDAIEPEDAIVAAFVVGQAAAVAGEGNHVGQFRGRRLGDVLAHVFFQLLVVLLAIPRDWDGAGAGDHGWNQAVFLSDRPILLVDQVDAAEADLGALPAEIVHRDFGVAPARGGLFETAGGRSFDGCCKWGKSEAPAEE